MPDIVLNTTFNSPNLIVPGFVDNFNRADASTLGTTENGRSWQVFASGASATWGISGNAAKYNGSAARSIAIAESYAANGTLTGTVGAISQAVGGFVVRGIDANNYIAVLLRQSAGVNRLQLVKRVAGTQTQLGISAADKLAAAGSVIDIVLDGTSVSVRLGGEQIIAPVTVADFSASTLHGLIGDSSDMAVTFDRVAFVAA